MMHLSSFFELVVKGDEASMGEEEISVSDLLVEATSKYPHIGRLDIEKRRFHHRLQVVQKLEDSQRTNVLRSVHGVAGQLNQDELRAIYAFVKNAQLQRLTR